MTFDKKKFNDTITLGCSTVASNKKKCINDVKKCSNSNTKCKNEYINMFNAQPKIEEITKCFSLKENLKKKCIDDIKKKTNYNELSAKAGHCIANKCPDIYNNTFKNKNTLKNTLLKFGTSQNNNKVVNDKCKKEINEKDNLFIKANECNKKYNTFDEQQKCASVKKIVKNYLNCIVRNSSKNSNKSNKSNTSKKSTKSKKSTS